MRPCGCRRSSTDTRRRLREAGAADRGADRGQHGRGGSAIDRRPAAADGIHADRAHDQPCLADADPCADRIGRDQRAARKLVRRLLHTQGAWADESQRVSEPVNVYEVTGLGPLRTRLQRAAGRGLTKFVGREREMEALQACRRSGEDGARPDRRRDGGAGRRQVAPVLRVQGEDPVRLDGARDLLGLAWQGVSAYLPMIDLLHGYFEIERRRRRPQAAREGHRPPVGARPHAWKTRCLIFSACSVSSRATIRWRRWTAR